MRSWPSVLAIAVVLLMVGAGGLTLRAGSAVERDAAAPMIVPAGSVWNNASNWAGYAAIPGSGTVTKVSAAWIEPTVSCTGATTFAAFWVGIDGASTQTVEQTGTAVECVGGVAYYWAWWELYPSPMEVIDKITVSPGDHFSASVSYTPPHTFSMKIKDVTTGVESAKAGTLSSAKRADAECIAERPEVDNTLAALAPFGVVKFSSCTATVSGSSGGIGSFAPLWRIDMVSGSTVLAATGTLGKETSFKVTWENSG